MEIEIKWTKNSSRISSLFVKEHKRLFTITTLNEKISFNAKDNEDIKELRKRIGFLLSGQLIGDTYKILRKYI